MPDAAARPTTRSCLLDSLRRYIVHDCLAAAVETLPLLARAGLRPPFRTLSLLLRRCLSAGALPLARRLHLFLHLTALKPLYPSHTYLCNELLLFHFLCGRPADARRLFDKMSVRNVSSYNAMLSGYARLGMLRHAHRVFDNMPHRDVVSWNTMIIGLARAGSWRDAVEYYRQLRRSSIGFNPHTFSGLIMACVRLADPSLIREAHGQVLILGFLSNLVVSSSLVDGYSKCGCLDDAKKIFDEMPTRDVLAWTTLVYGYAKSGNLTVAYRLFNEMPEKNPVSWTSLIGAYARHGLPHEALDLFRRMMYEGVEPDQFTFSSSLCACAAVASIKHGKQIHARLFKARFNPNAIVLSALVDMYSKCGSLESSLQVFNLTYVSKRDVVLWNTMISSLGQHGLGRDAIRLFNDMIGLEMKPNSKTFVIVLTACSHSGLVTEGVGLFKSMANKHHIAPEEDHYVSLVDILGRAGKFEEAVDWLRKMPYGSSAQAWKSLLGACRIHGNSEIGKEAAERLLEMEAESSETYVLLSNIYAEDGRWGSVEELRHHMEDKSLRKERALSWIEVDNFVHSFRASDQRHHSKDCIFATLEQLACQTEEEFSIT